MEYFPIHICLALIERDHDARLCAPPTVEKNDQSSNSVRCIVLQTLLTSSSKKLVFGEEVACKSDQNCTSHHDSGTENDSLCVVLDGCARQTSEADNERRLADIGTDLQHVRHGFNT